MRALMRCCAGMLLWSILLPAMADGSAEYIEADYNLSRDTLNIGVLNEAYTRLENHYHIESVSRATGLLAVFKPEIVTVISDGTVTPNGLRPDIFSTTRKLDADRNTRADFDWTTNNILLADNKGQRTLPLPPDTQDRLSAMYQTMFLELKNDSVIDFHMTNGSKLDIYNYQADAVQDVTVPAGTFRALHISSLSKPGENRTELWLMTEHANLPCKMTITEPGGGQFTQELTRIHVEP